MSYLFCTKQQVLFKVRIIAAIIMAVSVFPLNGFASGPVPKKEVKNLKEYFIKDAVLITGQVTDETGQPLSGVSINEKGTRNGTVTDSQGNFELNVQSYGSILVISFVGYIPKEVAAGQGPLRIILQKNVSS